MTAAMVLAAMSATVTLSVAGVDFMDTSDDSTLSRNVWDKEFAHDFLKDCSVVEAMRSCEAAILSLPLMDIAAKGKERLQREWRVINGHDTGGVSWLYHGQATAYGPSWVDKPCGWGVLEKRQFGTPPQDVHEKLPFDIAMQRQTGRPAQGFRYAGMFNAGLRDGWGVTEYLDGKMHAGWYQNDRCRGHTPSYTIIHHHTPSYTIIHHHTPSYTIIHHHTTIIPPSCTIIPPSYASYCYTYCYTLLHINVDYHKLL